MQNRIELLDPQLLNNVRLLQDVDKWLAVMDRPNGWHYDLDVAWQLKLLEEAGIRPGQTVLDAGAGLGVIQYVLASRGYNVISLDIAARAAPPQALGIFDITVNESIDLNYRHEYMNHMSYERNTRDARSKRIQHILSRAFDFKDWSFYSKRLVEIIGNKISNYFERGADHSGFGKIEFLRASFHQIPLPDACCDAVVSVSAIEHADHTLLPQILRELRRIVTPGGPVMLTTSATAEKNDVFHNLTKGWCFPADTLGRLVGAQADFESFARFEQELLSSRLLWSRMHPLYRRKDGNGLFPSRSVSTLPYLPVGILLHGGSTLA